VLALDEPRATSEPADVDFACEAEREPRTIATRLVRVNHDQGLHLRPCMAIAKMVNKYQAKITIRRGTQAVEAASILELLTLAASHDTELLLSATGTESQEALDAVAGLFASGFPGC